MPHTRGNLQKHRKPDGRSRAPAYATAAVMGTGFVFSMAANLPGTLSYDSVIQLLEGRTGVYSGWHPPVMSWLLGLSDWAMPGAALFVVAVALLFFASLLSLLWLAPRISWTAPAVAALCMLMPQVVLYQGIVWKDVLFADSAVAGFVALAHVSLHWGNSRARYVLIAVAILCLTLAALTRQNGIVLLPFGAFALGWLARRSGLSSRQAWTAAAAFCACAIVLAICASALFTLRTAPDRGAAKEIRILEFYDLIGGLSREPNLRLPELARRDHALLALMRSDGRTLYSPVRSDTLARSQRLQAALARAPDNILHRPWLNFVLQNPSLYLRERAEVFRWVFLTPDISICVPYVVGFRGPPQAMSDLGFSTRVSPRDKLMNRYGHALMRTPLFSHVTFLLLAIFEIGLLLWRRSAPDIAFASMLTGAIVFCASFFFISLACDYRYFYVLDLTALTALIYIALAPASPSLSRQSQS
ncbi:MAG TPA: hypothetical protein VHW69_15985 [Rhizomicrobium sp.]|nr:hypothetical protein [Rhizomicrobium sp.]